MIAISSPLAGWVTALDDVPDPVFAERMLGDGAAVDPVDGRVVAPGDGVVITIHPAGHAVTLDLDAGPVLLIHVGLDTIGLGGEGFTPSVKDGQRVAQGDVLIEFDLDLLARKARSVVTPVIVTNAEQFRVASFAATGPIETGQPLFSAEATNGVSAAEAAQPTISRSLRLVLAHGLHARPAARIAKLAGDYDAQLELVTEDGRAASARSPVAILGLGLRHGDRLTLRGGGVQAEAAAAAIADLLDSGMGELRPSETSVAPGPTEMPPSGELRGVSAVAGMAAGPAWRFRQTEIAVQEQGSTLNRNAFHWPRRGRGSRLHCEPRRKARIPALRSPPHTWRWSRIPASTKPPKGISRRERAPPSPGGRRSASSRLRSAR